MVIYWESSISYIFERIIICVMLLLEVMTIGSTEVCENERSILFAFTQDELWGYTDDNYEILNNTCEFRGEGYAVISRGYGKAGIINVAGEYVLYPEYIVDEGKHGEYYGGKDTGIIKYSKDGYVWGFFDVANGNISDMEYTNIYVHPNPEEDYIALDLGGINELGFYSRREKTFVIAPQYDGEFYTQFYEDWALVKSFLNYEEDDFEVFLIDRNNNRMILDESIIPLGNFSHGRCLVYSEDNSMYGYIDTGGNIVIPCIFPDATEFYENGTAIIVDTDGVEHIIDIYGNYCLDDEET